jgi:Flp pilus assembly protein TadG
MTQASTTLLARLRFDQGGEGVISTAIAVLIMAIIGGLMWVAFSGVFATAEQRVTQEVERIGD